MFSTLFPGGPEWIIILLVALLLFGPRLPSVMRSIGKGIVEFKRGLHDVEDEVDQAVDEPSKKKLEG